MTLESLPRMLFKLFFSKRPENKSTSRVLLLVSVLLHHRHETGAVCLWYIRCSSLVREKAVLTITNPFWSGCKLDLVLGFGSLNVAFSPKRTEQLSAVLMELWGIKDAGKNKVAKSARFQPSPVYFDQVGGGRLWMMNKLSHQLSGIWKILFNLQVTKQSHLWPQLFITYAAVIILIMKMLPGLIFQGFTSKNTNTCKCCFYGGFFITGFNLNVLQWTTRIRAHSRNLAPNMTTKRRAQAIYW